MRFLKYFNMMNMRCWLVLTVLLNVVSADKKVEGYEGDKVILPCVNNGTNLKDVTVFWRYQKLGMEEKNVYTLNTGKEYLLDQHTEYRNRTRMFPSEYEKGNFSLLLTDVKKSDAGSYLCFYVDREHLLTVELTVKGKLPQATTIQPKSNTAEERSNIVVLLLALFGVTLYTV